jgi:hypothetical protein
MTIKRNLLKNALTSAWETCIKKDYPTRCINSEHALQAYFFSRLKEALDSKPRQIFVEPRFSIPTEGNRKLHYIPDLIVCDTRQIIAVVELKYQPRSNPSFQKDFKTLVTVATTAREQHLTFINKRYRGEGDPAPYPLATDVVFVWAGVHKKALARADAHEKMTGIWKESVPDALANQLLVLHAHTARGALAKID